MIPGIRIALGALVLGLTLLLLTAAVESQDAPFRLEPGSTLTVVEVGQDPVSLDLVGEFLLSMGQGRREVSGLVVAFEAASQSEPPHRLTGGGTWSVFAPPGSPECLPAALSMDLLLQTDQEKEIFFTTELTSTETFPSLHTRLFQLEGSSRFIEMRIVAAPDANGPLSFFSRGNSNGDFATNISDAIHVLVGLFGGGGVLGCEDAADFDDDGEVDLTDAVALLGWLFLGRDPPAIPSCFCGVDATDDELGCSEEGGCQ